MADIRCPKCGGRTAIRTAKKDNSRYYVCMDYPDCRGRVLVYEEGAVDIGRERSADRPRRDNIQRRKEADSPKGMVPVDETPTNIWNKADYAPRAASGSPKHKKTLNIVAGARKSEFSEMRWPKAAEAAEHRSRRQGERSYPDGGAPRAARDLLEGERDSGKGTHRLLRRRRDATDSSWGDDWGDDSLVPKAAYGRPLTRKPSEDESPGGDNKPSVPRRKAAPKDDASLKEEEQNLPRSRGGMKGEPSHEKKKKDSVSRRQRALEEDIPSEKDKAPEPQRKSAPEVAAEKPRRPKVPESAGEESQLMLAYEEETALRKKKRSLIIIIIALIVAFLAIDGMIYAAVVLRSQGT